MDKSRGLAPHYEQWAIHGVRVTQQVVEFPQTLTMQQIFGEPNAEVRRIMVDRFGAERLMRESNAALLDDDAAHGKLWRLVIGNGDDDIVMLEVVNSSPEPIGYEPEGQVGTWIGERFFRHYMLRVPPSMRTSRESRSWTFSMTPDEFAPLVET
jgi:hypothetical protein